MVRVYLLLFLAQVVLAVIALISCLSAEEDEIQALPRPLWLLIILFAPVVGPIGWFLAGRPAARRPSAWQFGSGSAQRGRPRPLAPDDDPEFLHSISNRTNSEQSRQDREKLERWEADLRRREEELRRHTGDNPKGDRPET
ncbi:MAG TPA: PLD nuclease N-terminal domain-containing protein [Micromonosporaceae bacterium]|nr:PLD nuclease N-terminal domain-containing protein [Micromonosporaceae bacterium]